MTRTHRDGSSHRRERGLGSSSPLTCRPSAAPRPPRLLPSLARVRPRNAALAAARRARKRERRLEHRRGRAVRVVLRARLGRDLLRALRVDGQARPARCVPRERHVAPVASLFVGAAVVVVAPARLLFASRPCRGRARSVCAFADSRRASPIAGSPPVRPRARSCGRRRRRRRDGRGDRDPLAPVALRRADGARVGGGGAACDARRARQEIAASSPRIVAPPSHEVK